jgi:hypothetical protein
MVTIALIGFDSGKISGKWIKNLMEYIEFQEGFSNGN